MTGSISDLALDFIHDNADAIIKASPIDYVKNAALHGSLFDPEDTSGAVSSVDTKFFVDHTEPLEALGWVRVREGLDWPLGELLDGFEFLLIVPARPHGRSRPQSTSQPPSKVRPC